MNSKKKFIDDKLSALIVAVIGLALVAYFCGGTEYLNAVVAAVAAAIAAVAGNEVLKRSQLDSHSKNSPQAETASDSSKYK